MHCWIFAKDYAGVIATYFLDSVESRRGTALKIRANIGTENVRIAAMQRYLRNEANDRWSGEKSFLYVKSVSNQRIEACWGQLRKGASDWWMARFKDLRDNGFYSDTNDIHVECLLFCYIEII